MIKKLFCIFLLFVFAFNVLAKLFPYVEYAFNKEFIAKNLCENKAKPSMNCNGKCHLKKQLQKAEKNEAQGKSDSKEKWEDSFFSMGKKIAFCGSSATENFALGENKYSHKSLLSVFHPPRT